MKKVILVLILFIALILTSCTDQAKELEQLKIEESEIKLKSTVLIEKDKVETPTTKGKK